MDTQYGEAYRTLYEQHWWWRAREALILEHLERLRPGGGWDGILDVGCGDGLFMKKLSGLARDVRGVEPSADLLTDGNGFLEHIHVGPLDERFVPHRTFDLILMLDVLEHIQYPDVVLKRVRELLSPTGTLLVTVPAFMSLWTRHDELNHHYVRYTKKTMQETMQRAGIRPTHQDYFFHWTWFAKMGVKVFQRVLPVPAVVPKPPARPINALLRWVSETEHRTLSRLHPPFGSSLLSVAVRDTEWDGSAMERRTQTQPDEDRSE